MTIFNQANNSIVCLFFELNITNVAIISVIISFSISLSAYI